MVGLVSSFIPFPNIYWWLVAAQSETVCFDRAEHFTKMSYRNRYYIAGANGLIQLSLPLVQGREQRTVLSEVAISNAERWQVQHWRTLVSVYNRSPYFAHYEPSLQVLFDKPFTLLCDFNLASIQWMQQQLKLNFELSFADKYVKDYGEKYADLRDMKPGVERTAIDTLSYYQAFNERNGFLPNLSMLDLLFAEGPYAIRWLRENKEMIMKWGGK